MRSWSLVLAFSAAFAASTALGQEPITVATWNVGIFNPSDFENVRVEDFGAAVDPDVLILNEMPSLDILNQMLRKLNREEDYYALSSFTVGTGDLEVAIVSRYPLADIVEFDQSLDNTSAQPVERLLDRVNLPGIAQVNAGRGFLVARVPELRLIVVGTHLKSSRGAGGQQDASNAEKREFVAASMARAIVDLQEDFPDHTIVAGGDYNVGINDAGKNGVDLSSDVFSGGGDKFDETHAIFSEGLIDGLRMRALSKETGETYVGSDDQPDFPGTGAIDVLYVLGPQQDLFSKAVRTSESFGSDHRAVVSKIGGQSDDGMPPPAMTSAVSIVALLPNPDGEDEGAETITVKNAGDAAARLDGWYFLDKAGHRFDVPEGTEIASGADATLTMEAFEMPLNNSGDEVRLFDAEGRPVHSVSYARAQATPGANVSFVSNVP